jgi:hypothetical protein
MTRRLLFTLMFAAMSVLPRYALAHEGHAHKVMGTVGTRHENHLEVNGTDGKTVTLTLSEKTRILRGKAKITADDIKPGERVVATYTETKGKDGKSTMNASEVRLGDSAPAKTKTTASK